MSNSWNFENDRPYDDPESDERARESRPGPVEMGANDTGRNEGRERDPSATSDQHPDEPRAGSREADDRAPQQQPEQSRWPSGEGEEAEADAPRGASEVRELGRQPDAESEQPLEQRTHRELYNRAKELGVDGRSRMNKQQLVEAIRQAS